MLKLPVTKADGDETEPKESSQTTLYNTAYSMYICHFKTNAHYEIFTKCIFNDYLSSISTIHP